VGKPQLYNGKTRTQITLEGFERYGPEATIDQINRVFKEYGAHKCEQSMYYTVKGQVKRSLGLQTGVKLKSPEGINKTETLRELYRQHGTNVSYDKMQQIAAQKFPVLSFHGKLFYDARKDVEKEQRVRRQVQPQPPVQPQPVPAPAQMSNGTLEAQVVEDIKVVHQLSSKLGGYDKVQEVADVLKQPKLKATAQLLALYTQG
jgi:hypothetical protein